MSAVRLEFEKVEIGKDKGSSDIVYTKTTKEEVKYLYDMVQKVPCNNKGEEDDSYIYGEVQFFFNKKTEILEEILLYPVYNKDDEIVNGQPIDPPECIYSFEEPVREYLHSHMD